MEGGLTGLIFDDRHIGVHRLLYSLLHRESIYVVVERHGILWLYLQGCFTGLHSLRLIHQLLRRSPSRPRQVTM